MIYYLNKKKISKNQSKKKIYNFKIRNGGGGSGGDGD